jgi:hypothetical protein
MIDIVLIRRADELGAAIHWTSAGAVWERRGRVSEPFPSEDAAALAAISECETEMHHDRDRRNDCRGTGLRGADRCHCVCRS